MDVELGIKRPMAHKGKDLREYSPTEIKAMHDINERNVSKILYTRERGDLQKKGFQKQTKKPDDVATFPKKSISKVKSQKEFTSKEMVTFNQRQAKQEKMDVWIREKKRNDKTAEILEEPMPFRMVEKRSSLTDIKKLLSMCPQPQPPLTYKHLESVQLDTSQARVMNDQVNKMRTGMERLQCIVKKFHNDGQLRQDIDFLIANVGPAIAKSEAIRQSKKLSFSKNTKN